MLKVIKKDTSQQGKNFAYYICECSLCLSVMSIRSDAIKRWQESCWCKSTRIDITWNKYWCITILWYSHSLKRKPYWKAICDCWNKIIVKWESVKSWNTKSCWCGRSKFAHVNSRLYTIFNWMRQRCTHKSQISYSIYWWKWIRVLWEKYDDFFVDMYDSYIQHVKEFWEKNTSIDRIDSNWNYCKENCRWATSMEQWANTCKKRFIEFNWEMYRLSDLARKLWVKPSQIHARITDWVDLEAFFLNNPILKRKKQVQQLSKDNTVIRKFESIESAHIETWIPASNISQCCNNHRKTAGWYIWKFVQCSILIIPIYENNCKNYTSRILVPCMIC